MCVCVCVCVLIDMPGFFIVGFPEVKMFKWNFLWTQKSAENNDLIH